MYEEQIVQGDNYDKLSKTVCINILDFKYLKNDRFHNGYRLKDLVTKVSALETAEQKGMEKGIKATAKNLISMGLDKEAISKATGLSIEEIDELK